MTDHRFVGLVLAQMGQNVPITQKQQGRVQATLQFLSRLLLAGE